MFWRLQTHFWNYARKNFISLRKKVPWLTLLLYLISKNLFAKFDLKLQIRPSWLLQWEIFVLTVLVFCFQSSELWFLMNGTLVNESIRIAKYSPFQCATGLSEQLVASAFSRRMPTISSFRPIQKKTNGYFSCL